MPGDIGSPTPAGVPSQGKEQEFKPLSLEFTTLMHGSKVLFFWMDSDYKLLNFIQATEGEWEEGKNDVDELP